MKTTFFFFAIVLAGCFTPPDPPQTSEADKWQEVDVDQFTISLPFGWKHKNAQGTDSKCGNFEGDGFSLGYDLGMYSNALNIEGAIVEYIKIDGKEAKLVVGGDRKFAGIYFPEAILITDEDGKSWGYFSFNLYGEGLTGDQQKLAVQIFKTIKFKE